MIEHYRFPCIGSCLHLLQFRHNGPLFVHCYVKVSWLLRCSQCLERAGGGSLWSFLPLLLGRNWGDSHIKKEEIILFWTNVILVVLIHLLEAESFYYSSKNYGYRKGLPFIAHILTCEVAPWHRRFHARLSSKFVNLLSRKKASSHPCFLCIFCCRSNILTICCPWERSTCKDFFLTKKICKLQICLFKLTDKNRFIIKIIKSSWQSFFTAKCPYGEVALRQNVLRRIFRSRVSLYAASPWWSEYTPGSVRATTP